MRLSADLCNTAVCWERIAEITGSRPGPRRIAAIVVALVSPALFGRVVNALLTLAGKIANNPGLGRDHRQQCADLRALPAAVLSETAQANGRCGAAIRLATAFICRIDGLGVQRIVEPAMMTEAEARAIRRAFLVPQIGPSRLPDPG